MAGKNRRSSADLIASASDPVKTGLLSKARSYNYFQAIRLLRRMGDIQADAKGQQDDHIRIRPALSLGFPAADIAEIESRPHNDNIRYYVTANFMGLYGASSPLPTFYTEDLIAEESQDETVSRDFLDVIHHRLYHLLFQGWLKYRQFFQVSEEKNDDHIDRLFCLIGMGPSPIRRTIPQPHRLLRYIGLFTQYPRSGQGLLTLLRDALKGIPLTLIPCIKRMAKIPETQRLRMGITGSRLGQDTYLGEEIEDRMGKFRVQIGPLRQAEFLRFTPGNEGYDTLVSLTELYIVEPFEYEIELILAARQARTVCLGDTVRSVLGVTSWVFSEPELGEVRTRFAVNRS